MGGALFLTCMDRNDVLTVAAALVFVVALVGVVYVAITPVQEGHSSFTAFSLLDANGSSAASPLDLRVGETGAVTVVITNRENREMTYRVVARLDNRSVATYRATLADGATHERTISFTPSDSGDMTLHVLLYRANRTPSTTPYLTLRLDVTVTELINSSSQSSNRSKPLVDRVRGFQG